MSSWSLSGTLLDLLLHFLRELCLCGVVLLGSEVGFLLELLDWSRMAFTMTAMVLVLLVGLAGIANDFD